MKTYYANFYANNGTRWAKPITSNNKKELIKDIRKTAEGERFFNNECSWEVWTYEGDREVTIARGGITSWGKRYREL